jgi:lipoprotein-anchoring transpeptidase ErfK/SrfK
MTKKIQAISKKLKDARPRVNLRKPSPETLHAKRYHIAAGVLIVVVIVLIGSITWFYHNRALPNSKLANVSIAGQTESQLEATAKQQADQMKVSFLYKGKTTTAKASDLGVAVDAQKTAEQVLHTHRTGGFWQRFAIWKPKEIPLATTTNFGTFQDYTDKHFPDIMVDAKDAQLAFNTDTNKFDIQPGVDGQGFDTNKFKALLPRLAMNPTTAQLDVSSAPVKPLIEASALATLQTKVNQQAQQSLVFTYQGKVRYTVTPADIAKWVNFTPDPHAGKVSVTYDKTKIQQFLDQQVGPIIAAPPIDQKVISDPGGGNQIILQHGQNGYSLQDIDGLTQAILDSLNHNQPLNKEVTVAETPFKTVALTGYNKWIEVDLTHQRATLYVNTTPVNSFVIASGLATHPTEVGTFHVWYKTPNQVMTGGNKASGDYYYLPNVTWVTYFDKEEAFHTAYWLAPSQFGRPQSHGCINMTATASKIVYDFAPIGTTVVVHY